MKVTTTTTSLVNYIVRPRPSIRITPYSLFLALYRISRNRALELRSFEQITVPRMDPCQESPIHIFLTNSRESARLLSYILSQTACSNGPSGQRYRVLESSYRWRGSREWLSLRSNLKLIFDVNSVIVGYSLGFEACLQKVLEFENLPFGNLSDSLGQHDFQQFKRMCLYLGLLSNWNSIIVDVDEVETDYQAAVFSWIKQYSLDRAIFLITRSNSVAQVLSREFGVEKIQKFEPSVSVDHVASGDSTDELELIDKSSAGEVTPSFLSLESNPFPAVSRLRNPSPSVLVKSCYVSSVADGRIITSEVGTAGAYVLEAAEVVEVRCEILIENWCDNLQVGLVLRCLPNEPEFVLKTNHSQPLGMSAVLSARLRMPTSADFVLGVGLALCFIDSPEEHFALRKLFVCRSPFVESMNSLTYQVQEFLISTNTD